MRLRLALVNMILRVLERPHLSRAGPEQLRRSFETKARWLFRPPRGTVAHPMILRTSAGSVRAVSVEAPGTRRAKVLLYFHGGAFVFGSPETHSALLARLSGLTAARAVLPDYRKAPEHPFPNAVNDARIAWDGLLASGVAPENVVVGGDSAGGGLALALLGSLIADAAALPAGVFAFSPLTDMTFSGESITQNAARDAMLPVERIREVTAMYLADHDPADPLASPLFARFTGSPPVWLSVGDSEILRDDTLRLVERLRMQSVPVTLELGAGLPHVWPFFVPVLPEATRTLAALATWITPLLDLPDES